MEGRQEVQSANYRRRGKVDSDIQLYASNSARGEREKQRDRRGAKKFYLCVVVAVNRNLHFK